VADEHPDRRYGEERRRWPDSRLDDLADMVRTLAPLTRQVGVAESNIDQHDDDLRDLREWIREVEARLVTQISAVAKSCEDFHAEYRHDQQQAKSANRAVVVALIAASATIIAAAITALAVMTGG
jgi:cobalamin biosynthesis Mg chelatase CobN